MRKTIYLTYLLSVFSLLPSYGGSNEKITVSGEISSVEVHSAAPLIIDTDTEYQKVIGVNVERELGWKRFIIAHEFAHSILHYQEGRIYLHREHTKGKNADENDADYFAAALLMPRNSFRRVYTELTQKGLHKKTICSQLAREYGVPLESVTRRIEEIKV